MFTQFAKVMLVAGIGLAVTACETAPQGAYRQAPPAYGNPYYNTGYYAPPPGKLRSPVVTVEVTRRGRLNLHKYDEKLRAQLERYLVQIGILQEKQTLSVQVEASGESTDLVNEHGD